MWQVQSREIDTTHRDERNWETSQCAEAQVAVAMSDCGGRWPEHSLRVMAKLCKLLRHQFHCVRTPYQAGIRKMEGVTVAGKVASGILLGRHAQISVESKSSKLVLLLSKDWLLRVKQANSEKVKAVRVAKKRHQSRWLTTRIRLRMADIGRVDKVQTWQQHSDCNDTPLVKCC